MTKKKHIEVSEETHKKVKLAAVNDGITMADLVAKLIEDHIKKRG